MKLTIVTPVLRENNLSIISNSIPNEVDWICVFDNDIPKGVPVNSINLKIPLVHNNWGVSKVNAALDFIYDGFVYILDDDTILHDNFNILLNLSSDFDFIHFNQQFKNGNKRTGGKVKRGLIDIGNFIVRRDLIGTTFLSETDSMPDGLWAEQLYHKCKRPLYLNKFFSIYNYLR